jgi:HEAT repeat protein
MVGLRLLLVVGVFALTLASYTPGSGPQQKDKGVAKAGPPQAAGQAKDGQKKAKAVGQAKDGKLEKKPAEAKTEPAKPADPAAADEETLKSAHLEVNGAALLQFLRKRLPAEVRREQVESLLQQLAVPIPAIRNKAAGELVQTGTAALPLLHRTARDLDHLSLAAEAQACVEAIHNGSLVAAAIRLLALRKPEGTIETLLEYLPYADEEHVTSEIEHALSEVGFSAGKPHPALVKALADHVPVRRAMVAELLCHVGGAAQADTVRPLLHDPKAHVRMRTALVLAECQDPEAIPVLIDLLGELPAGQTKPVEDYLSQLAGEWALNVPPADDPLARRLRRDLWAAWWKSMDGAALLSEFRQRTLPDADREKAENLIRQLNSDALAAREKAEADLLAMGPAIVPILRRAMHSADGKNNELIRHCLALLGREGAAPLPTAAARLVGLRRPPGAAEVLLAYLPCAEEDAMAGEVREAIGRVARPNGKLDSALVRALDDRLPLRRTTAIDVICQAARPEERTVVRKLLNDPEPAVRLRVALALAGACEKDAVPILISLLDQLPTAQAGEAEDFLRSIAGDNPPQTASGEDPETRRKCREAWAAWWKDNSSKVELSRNEPIHKLLGYTLVVEAWSPMGRGGRVLEVDSHGRKRWEIDGVMYPMDASVVGHDHVLIAEYSSSRVTERDFKGKVIWEKQIQWPTGAQRLPNGNTFITTQQQIVEVDRTGKEVFTYNNMQHGPIMVAKKLRNGQICMLTNTGVYVRTDSRGKELKRVQVSAMHSFGAGVDFLPRDHVLMPLMNENKVVEYDATGKIVWEAGVTQPCSAHRLPNGNTLVAQQFGQCVIEINRAGKTVWEYKENVNPHYASRR